jgi:protein-disulfide isomerase
MPQIEKEYIETGKLKHVFMDFPLPMHKKRRRRLEVSRKGPGKVLEMHDKLFENSRRWEIMNCRNTPRR